MRKIFYFVALGLLVLSSCSQEENEFLNEDLVSKVETKALNIGDSSSVITPLVVDSNQFVDEGDDEVLDIYGIRNWVESLPEKNISIASLANSYNIIGL